MATEQRGQETLVEVQNLTKYFDTTTGVLDRLFRREPKPVRAVEDVNLSIEEGDVIGIAGESGCGKTTLGKLLVKLYEPTAGSIKFDGTDITAGDVDSATAFHERVQMIFQDPFESLNPRMTVFRSVAEPLVTNNLVDSYLERREKVIQVLNDVGLAPAETYLDQFPKELSGGELQRVAIARALVVNPDFVVADEPVSMLDVSIRAGVLNLMKELQDEYGLTYVFISHDLSLIRYMCNKTAIMYLGDIIEYGPTDEVVSNPQHPYTEALFDAVPEVDPAVDRQRADVTGEIPSPRNPPSGCKYHTRCAKIIPPDDWTGSQDAFRRATQFKHQVLEGELTIEDVNVDSRAVSTEQVIDELLSKGLELDLPEEHRLESERGDSYGSGVDPDEVELPREARQLLHDVARDIMAEDYDRARERLDGAFPTVCANKHPEMRRANEQITACHLHPKGTDE